MFKRIIVFAAILALPLLIGCGKAPETETQNADMAMKTAQAAQAEQYAPEAYQVAMDTLNAALAAKQEQDSKFALFRSYGDSKNLFVSSQALAEKAASEAAAQKATMQEEMMTLMSEVQALLGNANMAIAGAPRGKGTKADIELFKNDLSAANAGFEGAKADFEAENYMAAKVKLEAVKTKAQGIVDDIAKAKSKKK